MLNYEFHQNTEATLLQNIIHVHVYPAAFTIAVLVFVFCDYLILVTDILLIKTNLLQNIKDQVLSISGYLSVVSNLPLWPRFVHIRIHDTTSFLGPYQMVYMCYVASSL